MTKRRRKNGEWGGDKDGKRKRGGREREKLWFMEGGRDEGERERQTDRQTDSDRDRQTDRQTETETDREAERKIWRQREHLLGQE